jgi:hypothetical protein
VFLLNSRDPLVIATCYPNFTLRKQAPLLVIVRGYFAEFPYLQFPETPEASHLGSPVSVLGTISSIPLIPLFSRSPGIE